MKKVAMILVAAAFAVTGLSAGKPSAAEKECRKSAAESFKSAQKANSDAKKECNAKKGQEKKDCLKSAKESLAAAKKTKSEAEKSCKTASAAPAASTPGTPETPATGK